MSVHHSMENIFQLFFLVEIKKKMNCISAADIIDIIKQLVCKNI